MELASKGRAGAGIEKPLSHSRCGCWELAPEPHLSLEVLVSFGKASRHGRQLQEAALIRSSICEMSVFL